jgi:hypothetical protein
MTTVRVATYNVHMLTGDPSSGERPDAWPGQQKATAEALESPQCAEHFAAAFAQLGVGGTAPDIIGLQEGVPHMFMQPIADLMGMHLATFPSPLGRYRGVSGTLYPWARLAISSAAGLSSSHGSGAIASQALLREQVAPAALYPAPRGTDCGSDCGLSSVASRQTQS